jgi:RNA 3'-terminal phosphate cyclase
MHATMHAVKKLEPLSIRERREILHQGAEVHLSHLPGHIADRELAVISHALDFSQQPPVYRNIISAHGLSNVAFVTVRIPALRRALFACARICCR